MLKGGLVLIWELHMNLVPTLMGRFSKIGYYYAKTVITMGQNRMWPKKSDILYGWPLRG